MKEPALERAKERASGLAGEEESGQVKEATRVEEGLGSADQEKE
jgi:hypothetical protein